MYDGWRTAQANKNPPLQNTLYKDGGCVISAGLPYTTNPTIFVEYIKLLGFANQTSLPPLQASWGVTHQWTPFVLSSGLPVVT